MDIYCLVIIVYDYSGLRGLSSFNNFWNRCCQNYWPKNKSKTKPINANLNMMKDAIVMLQELQITMGPNEKLREEFG